MSARYGEVYVRSLRDERDDALAEVGRLRSALEAGDWYVRCLEDVQDGRPVRGLLEAKLGWTNALYDARPSSSAGDALKGTEEEPSP